MKKTIENLKETRWTFLGTTKKLMIWLLIIAISLFVLFLMFLPAFSSFTAGLLKISISIYCFYLFDRYAMKNVDTIDELKNANIAYAIFLACIAFLIGIAMYSV